MLFRSSCLEGPVVGSFEGDDRKLGPISGDCCPYGSVFRGCWGIAIGNWFLWLLFLFWSLDRVVGVFVISEWGYLIDRGDVSKHKGNLGLFFFGG